MRKGGIDVEGGNKGSAGRRRRKYTTYKRSLQDHFVLHTKRSKSPSVFVLVKQLFHTHTASKNFHFDVHLFLHVYLVSSNTSG